MLKYILTVFLLPLAMGCAQTKNTSAPLDEYKIKAGATVIIGNSTVTFSELTEDSRCPLNTQCIWMGRAVIEFSINGESKVIYFGETRPGEPKSLEVFSGFEVKFLVPVAQEGKNILTDEYIVTLLKRSN